VAVKILAADDSSTMRKVLEMTFAGEPVQLETVGSGEAAVERASETSPDVVIVDSSMPMDGYEVARALKTQPATAGIAVILLASQHHPYDTEKGRAAGVDDHILKPYDTQTMIDKVRDVLAKPRARAVGAPAIAAAPPPRPAPPSLPRPPVAPPAPTRTPGVGRPGPAAPSPRSTVAFGAVSPPRPGGRPALELAEDEPKAPAPARPAPQVAPAPAAHGAPAVPGGNHVASPPVHAAAPAPAAAPVAPAAAPRPAATPATHAKPAAAAAAATASNGDMAVRLAELGLTREQIEGVLGLSREVIERVVWEVVPDLAEVIIREEIRRLTAD
jgi:CheY-like chemotaxis protein